MGKLYNTFLSYMALKRLTKAEKISKKSDRRCQRSLDALKARKRQLLVFEKRLDRIREIMLEDIEEAERAVEASKEALDAVKSEHRIADEITIPTLVQSNKLILERVSADTAEQIRRQMNHMKPAEPLEG